MNLLKKKPVYLWKSMKAGMKSANGNVDWKLGEWQKLEGTLDICNNGFHASEKPLDAMGYVNCEIMAKVEVRGKSIKQEDKQAWTEMRIVKAYEWKKEDSVALSIFPCSAESMGGFRFRQPSECVIQGHFHGFEGAKPI